MERQTAEDDSGKTSFTDRDVEITQFYLYLTQIKKKTQFNVGFGGEDNVGEHCRIEKK